MLGQKVPQSQRDGRHYRQHWIQGVKTGKKKRQEKSPNQILMFQS